jgi:hypothetical protein
MTGAARTPQVRWVVAATEVHGDDVVDFDCLDRAAGSSDLAQVVVALECLRALFFPRTCRGALGRCCAGR